MNTLTVKILRWVDDCQPGWVECALVDARGHTHVFREKASVVSAIILDDATNYPRPGVIACEILSNRLDESRRRLVTVTTEKPWGCESIEGTTTFEVLQEQLTTEQNSLADRAPRGG